MAFGPNNAVQRYENEHNSARNTMMDAWRESLQRTQHQMQAPIQTAASQEEARAELEQRIRNGEIPCPACAARTFQDDSDDAGVSFQAPTHIPQAIAGVLVMAHEYEHVASEDAYAREHGMEARSTVHLDTCTCPLCGRAIVTGGATVTNYHPYSHNERIQQQDPFAVLDMLI